MLKMDTKAVRRLILLGIFSNLLIYYGWEAYAHLVNPEQDSNCLGWICEKVQCPPGYAVYIPEEDKFLPCEDWKQYVELGNKSVLR